MADKQYIYNELGVCLNPDIFLDEGNYAKHNWEIKFTVGQTPQGLWAFGYDYRTNHNGHGRPVTIGWEPKFKTRAEAEEYCISDILRTITRDTYNQILADHPDNYAPDYDFPRLPELLRTRTAAVKAILKKKEQLRRPKILQLEMQF